MFQAQLLLGTHTVLGPWMARGGDSMIITLDLVATNGTGTEKLKMEVFTKVKDASGDGTAATLSSPTGIDTNTVGRTQATYNGLNDLVRYKFTAAGTVGISYLFRALNPVFFDSVKP